MRSLVVLLLALCHAGVARAQNADDQGTLVVQGRGATGRILIDDVPQATLGGGTATLQLPPGEHYVLVDADGYRREPVSVVIRKGETTEISAELAPDPRPCICGGHDPDRFAPKRGRGCAGCASGDASGWLAAAIAATVLLGRGRRRDR